VTRNTVLIIAFETDRDTSWHRAKRSLCLSCMRMLLIDSYAKRKWNCLSVRNLDSSYFVGTRAGQPSNRVSSPIRDKIFFSSTASVLVFSGYLRISPGVKRPKRETDYSPPSSTEVKNAWSCRSSASYVFITWCLLKHGGQFYRYLLWYTLLYQLLRLCGSDPVWWIENIWWKEVQQVPDLLGF
jgi:hypothetical protein